MTSMPLGAITMLIAFVLWVPVMFITSRVTAKHFDRLLLQKNLAQPISMSLFPEVWGRGVIYSMFILVNGPRLHSAYGKQCKGFRFRKCATRKEFLLAYLNLALALISAVSILSACGVGPQIFIHIPAS